MRKKRDVHGLALVFLLVLLSACGGSQGPSGGANAPISVNWSPLYTAARTGPARFTLSAPVPDGAQLELRYRKPGSDWNAWKAVATFAGGQASAELTPPRGLDAAGTEVQARIAAGAAVLAASEPQAFGWLLPLWSKDTALLDLADAGKGRLCTAGTPSGALTVQCMGEDGAPVWTFADEEAAYYGFRTDAIALDERGYVFLGVHKQSDRRILVFNPEGRKVQEITLSAIVTALKARKGTLYVGGTLSHTESAGDCQDQKWMRYALFAYDVQDPSNPAPVAEYHTNGNDVHEYQNWARCVWSNSSVPGILADDQGVYAAIAYRTQYLQDEHRAVGCLALAKFTLEDGEFHKAWQAEAGDAPCTEPTTGGDGDWEPIAFYRYYSGDDDCSLDGCRAYFYNIAAFDQSDAYLKAVRMWNPTGPDPYVRKADGATVPWTEASGGTGSAAGDAPIHLRPGPDLLAFDSYPLYLRGRLLFARKNDEEGFWVELGKNARLYRLLRDPEGQVYLLAGHGDKGLLARLR